MSAINRRFSFRCEESGSAAVEVVSFEGEEALAGLYRFEILLVSSDNDIDGRRLVGHQGVFRLNDGMAGGEGACYSGVIAAFEHMHQITGWTFYKAVLVPRLWRLGQYYLTEVYLEKTPLELIDLVMEGAGLKRNEYNLRVTNKDKFPKRKFIFQFQESYLYFLSRWCERLGIYWWFDYQNGTETAVFSNNMRLHDSHILQLAYQRAGEQDAVATGKHGVQSFNLTEQSLPQRITVMDHDCKRASHQIKGTATVDERGIGEITYYGLHINSNEAAQALAGIRAQGLICRSRQFSGESTATGLRCGYFIELSGHPRTRFNQQYLLTQVSHHGSQAGLLRGDLGVLPAVEGRPCQDFYQASFTAIPADVQFRPEIAHEWPRINGNLTAYIDAEGSGHYAELNELGEYKVQLPYSITEKNLNKASAWIRLARPYSGDDYGMHFPLHKGTEVLLSFHNGNPDEPVILGAVHNSMQADVVTDENQTQSVIQTAGGNSLEFHDSDGKQGIHLFSPISNTRFSIGAPQTQGVGADTNDGTGTGGTSGISLATDGDSNTSIGGDSTKTVAGVTYTANYGNVKRYDQGTVMTLTLGAVQRTYVGAWSYLGLGVTSNFKIGGNLAFVAGFSINSTVGIAMNSSLMQWDKTPLWMKTSATKIADEGIAILLKGVDLNTAGTKLDSTGAHISSSGAQIDSGGVKVSNKSADINNNSIHIRNSTAIYY